MKCNTRKFIAVLLTFAIMIPMMVFSSSALKSSDGFSNDVIVSNLILRKSVFFTPEKSGVYEIFTSEPSGNFGRLINFFTYRRSDPEIEIYKDNMMSFVGGVYDTYSDETVEFIEYDPETGEEYTYMENEFLDNHADGFVYLEAGVEYELFCYNYNLGLAAFSVNVKYIGDASISFTAPEKTEYSIAAGEAYYVREGHCYIADISLADFLFDVTLPNGRHIKVDGFSCGLLFPDTSIEWNEKLGDCSIEFYLLGQTFTFEYTITE